MLTPPTRQRWHALARAIRAHFGAAEQSALRVAGLFALFGVLWILLSDRVVETVVIPGYDPATLQTVKGLVFVLLSAGLVFLVARRGYARIRASELAEHRETEERFRRMVERSEEVFFYEQDAEGRFRYISPSVSGVLGYDPAALLGSSFDGLLSDEDEGSAELRRRGLQGGDRLPSYRLAVSHTTGRTVVLEIVERPVYGSPDPAAAPGPVALQGLARDVTERHDTLMKLRRRLEVEAGLARISSLLAAGVRDAPDRVTAELGRLLGTDAAALFLMEREQPKVEHAFEWRAAGMTIPDGASPAPLLPGGWLVDRLGRGDELRIEDADALPESARADREFLKRRGFRSVFALPLAGKDLSLAFIALYAREPRAWAADDLQTLRVAGRMVTTELERRRAEELLRLLSRAVDQSPASIIITDMAGDIVYVNPKFTAVSGYAPDEVIGRNPRLLQSGKHDVTFYRGLWETIMAGREWRGEIQNRRKDGDIFWEVAAISGVLAPSGEVTHFVAVKEDVTENRLLQKKFEQAQKMDAVGRLAGGLAHDFNNVLTAIHGHARLVLDQLDASQPQRDDIEEIVMAADRAAGVIRQLLHFSRRGGTSPEVVDLNDVVGGLKRMLRGLLSEEVRLEVELCTHPCLVRADRGQMEQILINLAINARDAMPGGGALRIGLTRTDRAEASEPVEAAGFGRSDEAASAESFVRITVTDTGTGMSPDVQQHVFEPFFTTKETGKGTGLGLATVYGMVQENGGWISFRSEEERGTTFTLHFPALEADMAPGAPLAEPASGNGVPRPGNEVVLVVEDEASVRSVVRRVLSRLGYTVLEASDGADAETRAAEYGGAIHLLLTDTVMPGMRGPEVARRLRARRPEIRVLLMSGYTFDEADPRALLEDADFIGKPFTPESLAAAVRNALDRLPTGGPESHSA